MKTKKTMYKFLNTMKEDLQRHKSFPTPVIYIKGKRQPVVVAKPNWKDYKSKKKAINEVRKLCQKVKAKETILISDVFIHEEGYSKDALLVAVENRSRIYKVTLPYELEPDGTVKFGEEDWSKEMKKSKEEFGIFEGFVQ